MDRASTSVAVHQSGRPFHFIAPAQPPDLADRQSEQRRGLRIH
jgi:hypothetical protein